MHEFIFFNNRICRIEQANISAAAPAALYGKGMLTTVAVFDRTPFLWEKHWRRLRNQAEKLEINLSEFSEESIKNALTEIIAVNKLSKARARLTFFDEKAGDLWKYESLRPTSFLITTADFRQISNDFRLTISPFPVNSKSPLAGIKSCNYLENLAAFDESKKRGFDEAVRINERGEIVSACFANIFWLKNEKLLTPALETGCLNGTTREFLMENFDCSEVRENLETLNGADAVFLTSAGIGVVQTAEFQGRKFTEKFDEISKII